MKKTLADQSQLEVFQKLDYEIHILLRPVRNFWIWSDQRCGTYALKDLKFVL